MISDSILSAIDAKVYVVHSDSQGFATRLDHRTGINAVSYWRTKPEYLPRILLEFITEMDLADVIAMAKADGVTHVVEIGPDHRPVSFDEIL